MPTVDPKKCMKWKRNKMNIDTYIQWEDKEGKERKTTEKM